MLPKATSMGCRMRVSYKSGSRVTSPALDSTITMLILRLLSACALSVSLALALPTEMTQIKSRQNQHETNRVVLYYQRHYLKQAFGVPTDQWGPYVSPLPLIGNATHLIVAAVHINDLNSTSVITLNDTPPDDPVYDRVWGDVATMQAAGVKVLALIGGAQPGGCFWRLSKNKGEFDNYYPALKEFLTKHSFDGVDLDVEDVSTDHSHIPYDLDDMVYLIDRLKADFGHQYIITQAPVADALDPQGEDPDSGGMSGFNYFDLEAQRGHAIAFYNAQFYEGWGVFDEEDGIDSYMSVASAFPSHKVVASTPTNPGNVRNGFVNISTITDQVLPSLLPQLKDVGGFGGIAGWEYFNALPGGTAEPSLWAKTMKDAMVAASS